MRSISFRKAKINPMKTVIHEKTIIIGHNPAIKPSRDVSRECKVNIEISLDKETNRKFLNITGDYGNSCGQINPISPTGIIFAPGWNLEKLHLLNIIWDKYHLNDIKAGNHIQTDYLNALENQGWKYNYDEACEKLKLAGIYEINGEKYGHKWNFTEVPDSVINWLMSL